MQRDDDAVVFEKSFPLHKLQTEAPGAGIFFFFFFLIWRGRMRETFQGPRTREFFSLFEIYSGGLVCRTPFFSLLSNGFVRVCFVPYGIDAVEKKRWEEGFFGGI